MHKHSKDFTPLWSSRQVTNFSSAMSLDRLKRWHPTGRGFVSHVTPLASGGPPASFAYLHRRGIIKMPNRKYNCAGDLWIVTTRSGELRPPARPSCDSNMLEPFCCKVWRSRDKPGGKVLKLLGTSLYCGYNLPTPLLDGVDCPTTARRQPDDYPTTVRQLSDDCLTTARRLPDDCTTTARPLPNNSK